MGGEFKYLGTLYVKINVASSIVSASNGPEEYILEQNYPNPFNPATEIRYIIPKESRIRITVYNILGQKVSTLVNGIISPGSHSITWDGSSLASGIYFYILNAVEIDNQKQFQISKKMILSK
jgi:hypothetical protein